MISFLVTPQLKKEKRVGRFFCKNLEAKPLSVDRHVPRKPCHVGGVKGHPIE
jgi:hypothetical protein